MAYKPRFQRARRYATRARMVTRPFRGRSKKNKKTLYIGLALIALLIFLKKDKLIEFWAKLTNKKD